MEKSGGLLERNVFADQCIRTTALFPAAQLKCVCGQTICQFTTKKIFNEFLDNR